MCAPFARAESADTSIVLVSSYVHQMRADAGSIISSACVGGHFFLPGSKTARNFHPVFIPRSARRVTKRDGRWQKSLSAAELVQRENANKY